MRAGPAMMTASLLRSLSAIGLSSLVCPVSRRHAFHGTAAIMTAGRMTCRLLADLEYAMDKAG